MFLLVRHGAHDLVGKTLVGRHPGVHLNPDGLRQARNLAMALSRRCVSAVYSSPLARARETAEPIARAAGVAVEVADAINEIDFGDWTGQSFCALEGSSHWRLFNSFRSTTRPPRGELMLEAQSRIVGFMEQIRERKPDDDVVLVSHGDVIKAALMHVLGLPLDHVHRLEVAPGSISTVALEACGTRIVALNMRASEAQ